MAASKFPCNIGFDGRTFLTEAEWQTYLRRKPVRYIRKSLLDSCEVCGAASGEGNPFQNAHRIGFDVGIVQLALMPDFLDSDANITTAHRAGCNKKAELDLDGAMRFLLSIGVTELPLFLPSEARLRWQRLSRTG